MQHRLRREIVATILANAVINRMGIAFAHRYAEDHGQPLSAVVQAYAMAHEMFDGDGYWSPLQALDGALPAAVQLSLFKRPIGLFRHLSAWLLHQGWSGKPMHEAVARFAPGVKELREALPAALSPAYRQDWQAALDALLAEGVPEPLASQLANTRALGGALDIVELALASQRSPQEVATLYFLLGEKLGLLWLLSAIIALPAVDRWQALARNNLREDCYRLHRKLTEQALSLPGEAAVQLEHFLQRDTRQMQFSLHRLQEVQASPNADFMTLAVAVRELRALLQV